MSKAAEFKLWNNIATYGNDYDEETLQLIKSNCGHFNFAVEVGGAQGMWTHEISKLASQVIAIDFSKSLIKKLKLKQKTTACPSSQTQNTYQ